ncbi:glutamate receptor ionotropic, kainate 2-like [Zootermopsis nevadensis]|nr:glutamate receptor ionotropic, kainate 2-like [Zootermopsis nevadensis]
MSAPWTRQKGTFLVPKSRPLTPAMMLYLPLKLWTWVVLLHVTLIFVLILYGISRMLPSGEGCQYHSLCICLLDTFRMLMLNSCPRFPQQAAMRYLLTSWAFFSLLTMTTYSTGYTSLFTFPPYSPPINTVDDLLYQGIYWGERSNDFKLLFIDVGNPKLAEFGKRFKPEISVLDREKRILQGQYAVFTKTMSSTFVTETETLSHKARQKLRIMKEPVFTFYVAIGLCPNSPFKSHIDSTITRLQDAGIVHYWQRLMIQNLGYHYMSKFFEVTHKENTGHSALSLDSMQGAFCMLGMGLALSCITWFIEISTGHRNKMCTTSTYTKT